MIRGAMALRFLPDGFSDRRGRLDSVPARFSTRSARIVRNRALTQSENLWGVRHSANPGSSSAKFAMIEPLAMTKGRRPNEFLIPSDLGFCSGYRSASSSQIVRRRNIIMISIGFIIISGEGDRGKGEFDGRKSSSSLGKELIRNPVLHAMDSHF